MERRYLIASFTVISSAFALVVACSGGPGGLGEFGDDGLTQSQTTTTSSGQSSSGRSSTSTSTSTSSGGSSGITSSSGSTTSSGASSGTSTSGSSSGGFDSGQYYACGSTQCSPSQWCIHPSCSCGDSCVEYYRNDGGSGCPSGYTSDFSNPTCWPFDASAYACSKNSCTTPTPYCTSQTPTSISTLTTGGAFCDYDTDQRHYVCSCN